MTPDRRVVDGQYVHVIGMKGDWRVERYEPYPLIYGRPAVHVTMIDGARIRRMVVEEDDVYPIEPPPMSARDRLLTELADECYDDELGQGTARWLRSKRSGGEQG